MLVSSGGSVAKITRERGQVGEKKPGGRKNTPGTGLMKQELPRSGGSHNKGLNISCGVKGKNWRKDWGWRGKPQGLDKTGEPPKRIPLKGFFREQQKSRPVGLVSGSLKRVLPRRLELPGGKIREKDRGWGKKNEENMGRKRPERVGPKKREKLKQPGATVTHFLGGGKKKRLGSRRSEEVNPKGEKKKPR